LALSGRWLVRHLVLLLALAAMIALGRWQWDVAFLPRGDLRNLAYAIQWWIFAAIAVYMYARSFLDELRGATPPGEVRAAVGRSAVRVEEEPDDPELAAYNRMLADLDARSRRR
jgi:DNA-binding transcriptional regulator of glucitol operon